jgi:hypothetical protein
LDPSSKGFALMASTMSPLRMDSARMPPPLSRWTMRSPTQERRARRGKERGQPSNTAAGSPGVNS